MKRRLCFLLILLMGVLAMSDQEKAVAVTPEEQRAAAEVLLAACMKHNSGFLPLKDPDNLYALAGVQNVHMIGSLTGEYSINKTKSQYGVGGTDLGVMINKGDTTYIAFGDTFLDENQTNNWRNNVLAYTKDHDYSDGILFDGMIMNNRKVAKELLPGRKVDQIEMAKIPTGGICIGERMYLCYMSVRHWGPDGVWDCNCGAMAKSDDNGKTWQYLSKLTWPEEDGFCQMYPVASGDMIYVIGIGGGRFGVAKLMRVPADSFEDKDAYEYLTEIREDGTPVFVRGEEGVKNATPILRPCVGEMSVIYSTYLDEWIITYLSGKNIVLRTAKEIWGPYSSAIPIVSLSDYPIAYGAFMNERYVSDDGKKVAFIMSMWAPVYNTVVMEMELVLKD